MSTAEECFRESVQCCQRPSSWDSSSGSLRSTSKLIIVADACQSWFDTDLTEKAEDDGALLMWNTAFFNSVFAVPDV